LLPAPGFFAGPDNPGGGAGPKQAHAITIASTGSGKLSANPASAEAGVQVTLTAAPDAGNMFKASEMRITGDTSGGRVFTDPSVPVPLVYTFIMPDEAVTVAGGFFATAANTVYVTDTTDSGTGSLRQAITDVTSGGTVQVELPAGSVIALDKTISGIMKSLIIEGNGATLTRSALWVPDVYSLLRNGLSGTVLIVRRMHFKNAESTGNGTAIRWDDLLTLESCIFSLNHNISQGMRGAAIYKAQGDAVISGCTFYANTAYNSAVVGFGGGMNLTLIGNLFYANTADYYPIVGQGFGTGVTVVPSYNVIDITYGIGKSDCGWAKGAEDTDFTDLGITGVPFDTDTFVPVSNTKLDTMVPSGLPGFPATDFYGAQRKSEGAPGAVNAAQ
jgi:hypothetical protein